MLCISGSLIALKFDRADKKEYDPSIMRTVPSQATPMTRQNHFVEEVAKSLGENYATVVHRQ